MTRTNLLSTTTLGLALLSGAALATEADIYSVRIAKQVLSSKPWGSAPI
jgi:hypothetical protein